MPETKFMTNSDGDPVPIKNVQPYDRLRDKKVRACIARARKAREALEKMMRECLSDISGLRGERSKLVNGSLGAKGNFAVSSFDGLLKVEIKQRFNIMLDDRAKQARDMMLEYVASMIGKAKDVAGVDVNFLHEMITAAFSPNQCGNLSIAKVNDLIKATANYPKLADARSLLIDSMNSEKGKAYLIFSQRPDRQHDFEAIRLDSADCWPSE